MRKGLLSTVATALVGTSAALAQGPSHLPSEGVAYPSGRVTGVPALLSADAAQTPAATTTPSAPVMSGGSTGLMPGVDCLPSCCQPAGPRFFGDVSYLLMYPRNAGDPGPLAIVVPANGPVFGPGTFTVLGGQSTEFNSQNGLRASAGMWLGNENKWGVEIGGLITDQATVSQAVGLNGNVNNPVFLGSPFFNPINNQLAIDEGIFAGPGLAGTLVARNDNRLWGAEANVIRNWRADCNRRTDILVGFTYYDLLEHLFVDSIASTDIDGVRFTNVVQDAYGTRNQFYGGQVGTRTSWTRGPFTLTSSGKVALGFTHEVVDRNGNSTIIDPINGNAFVVGGFYNQVSNIGIESKDRFSVALPGNIQLAYQVTQHISAFVGWDFIYISNVARPNDQVSLVINPNFLNGTPVVGPIAPRGGIATTEYWANGIQFGLSMQF